MRKVLILGGCGFIGSHLCDELIAHGYQVRVLDDLDPQVHGDSHWIPDYMNPKAEIVIGDAGSPRQVKDVLGDVDAVVHLAARVGVAQSAYEMSSYIYCNTLGTAVLLETIKRWGSVKRLIVASSMSVYGEGQVSYDSGSPMEGQPVPTAETKPPDLQSIYALTKYDQERMCLLFGRAYNVPTIALRLFNVYGTRQSLSNPYTGAIAIFASRLMNGKPPIIYEDGQQRRDFVHVSDVVRGIRLALESDVKDEAINIGSGSSHTILELAEILATEMGKAVKPEITGQKRVGDIRHCFADISKARRLLGYEPQMSLQDGMAELIDWLDTQTAIDRVEEHRAELVEKGLLV